MKNILLVFTGGTIGSTAMAGTINTSDAAGFKLIQLFQQHDSRHPDIHFKCIRPLQLLSENMAPAAWETLIQAIEVEMVNPYDGVIVTHGTDTLAFTAAALGLYFNALAVPLLLVSSDHPLDHPKANGLANFMAAVEFIRQQKGAGVFVPYANRNQDMQIHLGTRLASSLQLSGDFMSVQARSYGHFEMGLFFFFHALSRSEVALKADFSKRILLIKPYPGLDYSHFNLDAVDGVLHDLYHSGTACASPQWGDRCSLLAFIKRSRELGINVYLAPAIKSEDAYESTRELLDAGATMIWNTSLECAYAKLLLAYGNFNGDEQRADFLNKDIAGELVS